MDKRYESLSGHQLVELLRPATGEQLDELTDVLLESSSLEAGLLGRELLAKFKRTRSVADAQILGHTLTMLAQRKPPSEHTETVAALMVAVNADFMRGYNVKLLDYLTYLDCRSVLPELATIITTEDFACARHASEIIGAMGDYVDEALRIKALQSLELFSNIHADNQFGGLDGGSREAHEDRRDMIDAAIEKLHASGPTA